MKKKKTKMNETKKFIIAISFLILSIGCALIINSLNFNKPIKENDEIKKEEFIYTANTKNPVYMNEIIVDDITIYKTSSMARQALKNKPFYLKHKVSNKISWFIKDNEITFHFDTKEMCEETMKIGKYPELSDEICKKKILRTVKESYVGFVITNKIKDKGMIEGEYYLRGGISEEYQNNVEIMKKAFGYSTDASRCIDNGSNFACEISNLKVIAYDNGSINVIEDNYSCSIDSDGTSYCNE